MTEKPDGKRRGRRVAACLLSLLMLYPLSVGPAVRVIGVPTLVVKAYEPVFRLARVPGLREALAWYLNAWSPETMVLSSDPDSGICIFQPPAP
jgi:hypothetical protein